MGEVLRLTLAEMRVADAADDAAAGAGHPASALAPGTLSPTGVAVAGADGYLFIANGANNWERQFLGELQIPPTWFDGWGKLFVARQAEAARRGVELCNIVIPEKQAIYADKRWPHGASDLGAQRPSMQLLPRLGPEARLLYPAAAMATARGAGPAYFRHNSHWTASGCCAAIEPLLSAVGAGRAEDRRFAYAREHCAQDLTVHFLDPPPTEDIGLLVPCGEVFFDNRAFETTGRPSGASWGVHHSEAPDPRTVILFGDSFSHRDGLSAALSAVFAKVVFVWSKDVRWDLVAEHAADLVVWEHAERFLATIPTA